MKMFLQKAVVFVFVCSACQFASSGESAARWLEARQAVSQGLPQTAIDLLNEILAETLSEERMAEAARALVFRINAEGVIEGGKPEERVFRLEAELENMPAETHPVLRTVLARWYWDYFRENRWRFMRRTEQEEPGDDLQAWPLQRILAEIDRQFSLALADREALRRVPVSDFKEVMGFGEMPEKYRPTLYVVLMYEALAFYAAGEQAALLPEDAFVVRDGDPVFDDLEAFLAWEPEAAGSDSPLVKAIGLYQELIRHHRETGNRDVWVDADLARLRFGYNTAVGEMKNARYLEALQRFAEEHRDHEIYSRAQHQIGRLLREEGDPAGGRRAAADGAAAHPGTVGARLCESLIAAIEAPMATLRVERVWSADPELWITYRNLEEVHLRLVPLDFEEFFPNWRSPNSWRDRASQERVLAIDPVLEWSERLPATEDYRERTERVSVPVDDLEPGFYFLLGSHEPDFPPEDSPVSAEMVWVGDLAMVVRQHTGRDGVEGLVVEAESGRPVQGARITAWSFDWRREPGWERLEESPLTDEEGFFRMDSQEHLLLIARHNGHEVGRPRLVGQRARTERDAYEATVFFTDRSIYRPGQTIHYKGISHRVNHATQKYETMAGRNVTVFLRDANRQVVARQRHRTNDYGSFSGSFVAPDGRLTGLMRIEEVSGAPGSTSISVEEYKRPRFRVELDAPEDSPRLGDEVTLSGRATAYTGAAVGGAQVRWKVEREPRFPPWVWWRRARVGSRQVITRGTALTERDGSFSVSFPARPDPKIPESDDPVFSFEVQVDVTDAAGETRSESRTVRVGHAAMRALVDAGEWQSTEEPTKIGIRTETLEGNPVRAEGTVSVFSLVEPDRPVRGPLEITGGYMLRAMMRGDDTEPPAGSRPEQWETGELLARRRVETDEAGNAEWRLDLKPGAYRVAFESRDRFGRPVTTRETLLVLDPVGEAFPARVPSHLAAPGWSVEPGEVFTAFWGTGYESGPALVEIERRGETFQRYWTETEQTQHRIEHEVPELFRGGFVVRVTHVRENRAYVHERVVDVPWSNKELTVRWERFRSKLEPGGKETWTAVIEGPESQAVAAEMVATLYDASLDAFRPPVWLTRFPGLYREQSRVVSQFENAMTVMPGIHGRWSGTWNPEWVSYPGLDGSLLRGFLQRRSMASMARAADGFSPMGDVVGVQTPSPSDASDLDTVAVRKNLDETAFFLPHLTTDENGTVRMTFTMPEGLTEWRFLAFAHDTMMRSGVLDDRAVTAKELMVQPLAPRFTREGDVFEFPVTVSNMSDADQSGRVRLRFFDARTLDPRDENLGNLDNEMPFESPAGESRTYFWRLHIPDGTGFLVYRAVAASDAFSDGEEGGLPVLSRRIFLTESLSLPVRGPEEREFLFDKLLKSGDSETLRSEVLTVQAVSQPAWYAVMALPYLMEFPHDCSEQVFNRLYANALARHIANADPNIRRIFNLWKNTPALDSPLEKNEDLKSVALEATPWVRQAISESEARRNVGILFDENRLDDELRRTLRQLSDMQYPSGFWPWFSGGRPSEFITLYIATGFARLRHLGVEVDHAAAHRAIRALDGWMEERHRQEPDRILPMLAFYLYGRSFYLEDLPVADDHQEAFDHWVETAKANWTRLANRKSQAHLALALHRMGERRIPADIMRSLRERAVVDREMGMFWRDTERQWWWYRAPIETQALMIEAFAEITEDTEAVEECAVWLIKQKQTQHWRSTKATADAVYAILLRGTDRLTSDDLLEISLDGEPVEPVNVEPGTGFYETRFLRGEIRPEMGRIEVSKPDEGVAWGSVHWQYFENIENVAPHAETPLRVSKRLYVKEATARGPVLRAVDGPVSPGDELVARIEVRTDRDLEYVHLKDHRGSGTEPVNVLSGYRFQDGLRYYESTRDTASHFFIDYLPRGTYVFEYSLWARHRGTFESGIATVQCMYAPEFNSHSESITFRVADAEE